MFVRKIDAETSLLRVRELILYSRKKLDSHPAGKSYASAFEAMQGTWWEVFKEFVELTDQQTLWRALVEYADHLLDDVVDQMDEATIDLPTLRQLFFEGLSASVLKRPIAGSQLKKLQQWAIRLQGENIPNELKALLPNLLAAVEMAVNAVKNEEEATEKLKTFNLAGPRKQLLDTLNKTRDDTFVSLISAFEKESPAYRASLVRRFLVRSQEATAVLSLEDELQEINANLSELKQQEASLESRRQELLTKKAQQDRDEQEQQEQEARLAALQQEAALLQETLARKKKRKR